MVAAPEKTLTPISDYGKWVAKREDLAWFDKRENPSGAKVRQFMEMAAAAPGKPMVVGCSGDSAMSVYVAYAARVCGVRGIIVTPARAKLSPAIEYAKSQGAEIVQIRPGYPSVYRAKAREIAKQLGGAVRWDSKLAIKDTAAQCANLPAGINRVVVPSGSGLTAIGVLAGLSERPHVSVLAIAVSDLAGREKILETAKHFGIEFNPERLTVTRSSYGYGQPLLRALPDGFRLDPYYAAKALIFVDAGDCLWVSGRRAE